MFLDIVITPKTGHHSDSLLFSIRYLTSTNLVVTRVTIFFVYFRVVLTVSSEEKKTVTHNSSHNVTPEKKIRNDKSKRKTKRQKFRGKKNLRTKNEKQIKRNK